MMTKYYKDCYGCTAKITERRDGTARLSVSTGSGYRFVNKVYDSFSGARISLGKIGAGMFREVDNKPYNF